MKSIANKNVTAYISLDLLELRMAGKWSPYPRESTRGRRIQPQKLDKVTVRPALQSKQSPGTGVNDVPGLDTRAASEIRTPDLRITAVMPLAGCEWTAR